MINCLIVGAGGAIGALGRYLLGLLPVNTGSGFPLKTFLINVIGCLIIGAVAALAEKNAMSPGLVLFIKTGICGGFTTFSSFALETEGLMTGGSGTVALAYMISSLILGVAAVYIAEKMVLSF